MVRSNRRGRSRNGPARLKQSIKSIAKFCAIDLHRSKPLTRSSWNLLQYLRRIVEEEGIEVIGDKALDLFRKAGASVTMTVWCAWMALTRKSNSQGSRDV